MKQLLLTIILFAHLHVFSQDVYKNGKFIGGYFYINTDAMKDILLDGDNTDINGEEYWNNSPFNDKQGKDSKIRGKIQFDLRYGYFPIDKLAIGSDFIAKSNSYNEEDTMYSMQNKSLELLGGPFVRYYFELGHQPYEIGAIFLEGAYNYGLGWSNDQFKFQINDSIWFKQNNEFAYRVSDIRAKIGFSWYLTDFVSHNWFTGYTLALEPSIAYHWTTKYDELNLADRVQKSRGFTIAVDLFAYF